MYQGGFVANITSEGRVVINEQRDRKAVLSMEAAAHADIALDFDNSFARDSLPSRGEALAPVQYDPVAMAILHEEQEIEVSLEKLRTRLQENRVIES